MVYEPPIGSNIVLDADSDYYPLAGDDIYLGTDYYPGSGGGLVFIFDDPLYEPPIGDEIYFGGLPPTPASTRRVLIFICT